jgi:ring-1,2-phenylacetyl-CoA epoxidase subunit PaaC
MLAEPTLGLEKLEAAGVYPDLQPSMFERWSNDLRQVVEDAGLRLDLHPPAADSIGGRRGRHSDAFLPLLDELTEVYRLEPEAAW